MHKFEKKFMKKKVEDLSVEIWKLWSNMICWILLGTLLLPTIIAPIFCYGFAKKAWGKIDENRKEIAKMNNHLCQEI